MPRQKKTGQEANPANFTSKPESRGGQIPITEDGKIRNDFIDIANSDSNNRVSATTNFGSIDGVALTTSTPEVDNLSPNLRTFASATQGYGFSFLVKRAETISVPLFRQNATSDALPSGRFVIDIWKGTGANIDTNPCLLYTSPSPRDS